MAKTILLVRHGETEWSATGRHTGRTDIALTDTGEREGRLIGEYLAGRRFELVLSSPAARARDTCRLADVGEAELDDDLWEWDYGDFEGRTTADIRTEVPGWTVWTHPTPGAETPEQVAARVDRVLDRVRAVDGEVVLVAHGHLLRVLGARWLDQPPQFGQRLVLGTAALCTLGIEREATAILAWNERCHLLEELDRA